MKNHQEDLVSTFILEIAEPGQPLRRVERPDGEYFVGIHGGDDILVEDPRNREGHLKIQVSSRTGAGVVCYGPTRINGKDLWPGYWSDQLNHQDTIVAGGTIITFRWIDPSDKANLMP